MPSSKAMLQNNPKCFCHSVLKMIQFKNAICDMFKKTPKIIRFSKIIYCNPNFRSL